MKGIAVPLIALALLMTNTSSFSQQAGIPQISSGNTKEYPANGQTQGQGTNNSKQPAAQTTPVGQPNGSKENRQTTSKPDQSGNNKNQDGWDRFWEKMTKTDPNWVIAFLTFGLLITAAVQAAVYWLQKDIMSGQLKAAQDAAVAARKSADAAVATQRAWIKIVQAEVYHPLRFADQNPMLGLQVTSKNTGNSPATNVNFGAFIVPDFREHGDLTSSIRFAIDNVVLRSQMGGENVGNSVFPTDELTVKIADTVSRPKIQDVVENYNKPTVFMVLAICADYRFAGGVGRTIKTYLVRGWDSGIEDYTDIDASRTEIPEGEIRLQKLPLWDSAS